MHFILKMPLQLQAQAKSSGGLGSNFDLGSRLTCFKISSSILTKLQQDGVVGRLKQLRALT